MEDMQVYTYEQLDMRIKVKMRRSAEDLVGIGYLLRHMMEEKLWTREHNSFDEYLNKNLHMDYSMASRFIKAQKKYSDSEDGEKLDTKWKDYSQSVLIEMLNMPPELEEKVTPEMTVKQVREVKKQKRTKMKPDVRGLLADPYCAACGELLDECKQPQKCPNCGQTQDWEWYDRFFGDNEQPQDNEAEVSTSQLPETHQEKMARQDVIDVDYREVPEKLSAYGLPKTVYPEGSLITTEGCGHKYSCFLCARECDIRQTARQCREAPCGNPFGCQTMEKLEDIRLDMGEKCQFINDELAYKAAGDGTPDPCCKKCTLKSECDFCCEAAKRQMVKETLATSQDSESAKPDVVLPDKEQAAVQDMPKEGRQPELPILKNDSQRKEWLRNYKEWGRWYRDDNIDVNYYKYDFSEGSRLIVAEYPQRKKYYGAKRDDEYYYHLLERNRKDYDGRAYDAEYCQETDSETYMMDFLKNLQKKGGKRE